MSPLNRTLTVLAASVALASCATVPQPLVGNYANVSTASAQQGGAGGARVRWGGEIIKTEPGPQETCFFVLARPLDAEARPSFNDGNDTQGRFVACHAGFYDPEVFSRGRELTVTGTVSGTVSQKVGGYDYAYPRVAADVVYLWPPRRQYDAYPPGFYDPYWGPWGPWGGWGPWAGPWGWYGGPNVIVVRRPPPPPPPPHH